MIPFADLLDAHLKTRNWTRAEFAKRVGMTAQTISAVLTGSRKPWYGRAERWSDALDLKGREREEFLDAMAIAASPARVAVIVARLGRKRQL